VASVKTSRVAPADVVITDAIIYTADMHRTMARALAIGAGKLLYVGEESGAGAFIGPHTRIERLQGRLVLPGLVDSHIHPTDIADEDVCDLENRVVTLRELAAFVRG